MRFGYRRRRWWCWDWDGLSGRASLGLGEKSGVEALLLSLSRSVVPELPVPGARCKVPGVEGVQHQAPKHQAPLRSGHGLLIFDCVHGPLPLDLTAHWPLLIGHGSRELGTLLPLDTPLFTSWQVH